MSHTEVYDPRAAERVLVNEINRAVRRCLIGKVVWKWLPTPPSIPIKVNDVMVIELPTLN